MSTDTGNFILQSRKFRYERSIEVDGEKTSLIVDIQFNDKDGTFRILPRQNLKTTSRNPASRAAVSQQIERMREEGVDVCLALNKEYKLNNGEDDETDLFSSPKQRYEASKEAAENGEEHISWNEVKGRYENEHGNEWNPNDGGTDDEGEPGNTATDPKLERFEANVKKLTLEAKKPRRKTNAKTV